MFVILTIICILSFTKGQYLLGNDNYSPELNPSLTIERSIESPAWRSYRVLGFGSESEQADIFRSAFFWVTEKFLSRESLGQVFGLMCLFVGSWFMGELVGLIVKDFSKKKYSQVGLLLGGVMYVSTLWTVWVYYQNLAPFTSNFGFLPLLLFSIYLYIKNSSARKAVFLFLSSILFTSSCVIATLFVSDLLLIIPFVMFCIFSLGVRKKDRLKRFLHTFLIFGITQLFWILPFIFYTFSSSGDLVDSYVNRSITSSVIDLESEMQTLTNSSRFYTRTLNDVRDGEYVFALSEDYQSYDFYKVIGLLPIMASLISIIFFIAKKKWKLLVFPLLTLVFLFLIKGINPPLGGVFTFFQENIPLFKQVFRWISSKLGEVYLITLIISAVLGIIFFWDFLQSFMKKNLKKILGGFLLLLILALQLFYSNYLFTNNIFADELLVDLPQEYFSLGEYLEETNPNGRIYYAPPANNNYFREYSWGFYGSQFLSYIVPNPIMDMSLSVGSGVGEEAMLEIQNIFRAGELESFKKQIQKYDVEYILVDRNLIKDGFTYDIDWEIVDHLIKDYEQIWSEGELTLYEIPSKGEEASILEYTLGTDLEEERSFTRDIAQSPRINIFNQELQNVEILDNKIVGQFTYTGNPASVLSNVEEVEWENFPTGIKIEDSKLVIYPASPTLSEYYEEIPKKVFSLSGYEYISINNHVFSLEDLQTEKFIDTPYRNIDNIFGIDDEDFKEKDMTTVLSQSQGFNCRDEEIVEDTEVLVQEGSSGFSLTGEEIPCIYQNLDLEKGKEYILKLNLNWEATEEDTLGFCLYSESEKGCLNKDRYVHIQDLADERTFLIDKSYSGTGDISLILYGINIKGNRPAEIFLRDISLEYSSLENSLKQISFSNTWEFEQLELKNGNTYGVEIPIVEGGQSYFWDKDFVWELPSAEKDNEEYSISTTPEGLRQEVLNQTLTQSQNLFTKNPEENYLVFWKGTNTSNIPAKVCLSYKDSGECWIDDLFTGEVYVNNFSTGPVTNRLDVLLESVSYKNKTDNTLNAFGIMEIPEEWNEVEMLPSTNIFFTEYEVQPLYNSSSVAMYKLEKEEIEEKNVLLSIPQKESKGWIALNGIKTLGKDTRVTINGWKQAWDISNLDYNSILVIYWPNLLGYLGYILIVIEGIYLTVKLFKKKDGK